MTTGYLFVPVHRRAVRAVATELVRTQGARALAGHQRRQRDLSDWDRRVGARGGGSWGHRDHRVCHRGRRGEGGGALCPHSLLLKSVW